MQVFCGERLQVEDPSSLLMQWTEAQTWNDSIEQGNATVHGQDGTTAGQSQKMADTGAIYDN